MSSSILSAFFPSLSQMASPVTLPLVPSIRIHPFCLPDDYVGPTFPWIILPCDMSLLTKQSQVFGLTLKASIVQSWLISPPGTDRQVCLLLPGWFLQMTPCLFLTSYHYFQTSHDLSPQQLQVTNFTSLRLSKVKIQLISLTRHIWSTYWPHMAGAYCTRQHRHGTFSLLQKSQWTGLAISNSQFPSIYPSIREARDQEVLPKHLVGVRVCSG